MDVGIQATKTLWTNRTGDPSIAVALKQTLEKKTKRGTGFYICESSSDIVYVCWRDICVVILLSTAYPGHSEPTVTQTARVSGEVQKVTVPIPITVAKHNTSMGGVDKSDQLLSYHNVLRRTAHGRLSSTMGLMLQ